MATTDYDFNQTRAQIIERAFRIIGILEPGQVLGGNEMTQGVTALNALVKQWQSKSVFLWTIVQETKTLAVDASTIALDNSILGIDKAWRKEGTSDIEIEIVSFRRFQEITDKTTTTNSPLVVAIDHAKSVPTMHVYPTNTSAAAVSIYCLVVKRLQDMDSASGNPDIPQRFLQALTYGLSDLLADEYGMPLRERQYIKSKSDEYFYEAVKSDYQNESVTMVEPAFPIFDFK